jgi:hypothetical protein
VKRVSIINVSNYVVRMVTVRGKGEDGIDVTQIDHADNRRT